VEGTVTRPVLAKTISQFWPLAASDPETVDRYYRTVHSRFARRTLRGMEHVVSYHTARAEAAYDLNAGWDAPPETFRYVTLRLLPGRSLEFTPEVRSQVSEDHRVFLRGLRGFAVTEEVLLDRTTGQTSLVKYVVEYDRPPRENATDGADRLAGQLEELTNLAMDAFGMRRLVANHVRTESYAAPIDEPGQAPTGEVLASTQRQSFVEIFFDHRDWAEEWFGRDAVRSALLGSGWARVHGVRVTEECGLDRR
jgi:hypothetical protein